MITQAFLDILIQNPKLPLYFEYQTGQFVRSDYHITEIKNVSYDTVDCGGVQNKWEETIVQGVDQAPAAFIGLFTGENMGKMIVQIGDDPTKI